MARILILTLVFSPDGVSTATIVSELAEELQSKGHELSVITTVPHYNVEPEARAQQPLRRRWRGLFYRSAYYGIPVWHTTIARRGQKSGGRMLGYLIFNILSLIIGLFGAGRQDVILVVSPPLTSGVVGWLLAVLKRAVLIYNVQELYPDTFIKVNTLRADAPITRALFWVERFVYRHAKVLTVICESFRQAILVKGTPAAKIRLIPNFVDTSSIQPGPKSNALAETLGLAERYVVLYAGNIGMTQSFDTLLEAAQCLQDIPDIRFLIVGDGVRRQYVAEQIKQRALANVVLLPYQPRSRVPDIYATADLGLVPLMTGTAQTTLPSKLYTIMASGRPVLVAVDAESDIVETVETAQCGLWVPPDNADALELGIRQAFGQQDAFRVFGENGRRHVDSHFSRAAVGEQYDLLIHQVAESRRR
ncbi:MAG: glycosyltransferase family 4 protein [Aggregatilineales bacterium]